MKTLKAVGIGILFGAILVLVWLYLWEAKKNTRMSSVMESERQEYLATVDSLKTVAENAKAKTDTIWRTITKVITERDTIIKEIETMPPDETLAFLDSLTPGAEDSKLVEGGEYAFMPMERVKDCAIKITERNYFEKELALKDEVILTQAAQNKAQEAIIDENEGLILLLDKSLSRAEKSLSVAKKNCTLITMGAILLIGLVATH